MKNQPEMCRREAFELFQQQLDKIETTEGLLQAAIAISMHALENVDPQAIINRLGELSERVRSRVRTAGSDALLAHLHQVLFDEEKFHGNRRDYYDPYNSYLSQVIETRRGIPIALCLIYKVVAEDLGLEVEGVNAPGHFLARVQTDRGPMIVDPFLGGGVLTEEEAFDRVEQITGRSVPRLARYLAAASHAQWLSRMLVNLQHIFASAERRADLAAMSELQSLLDYSLY